MTCVGGYKIVEDKDIPKNLRKFQKDVITRANVNRIKTAIWKQFLKNAEVFFTPIYLPHLTQDDLTLFKQYSLLYLENK